VVGEKSYQRPELVEHDHLEGKGKHGVLHLLVEQFLAGVGVLLVLQPLGFRAPAAEDDVEGRKDDLHDDGIEGLVADQVQYFTSVVVVEVDVGRGNPQVEDEMQHHRRYDDEHDPLAVGDRKAHVRQPVHNVAPKYREKGHEGQNYVDHHGTDSARQLVEVYDLRERKQQSHRYS
jgi:hypothetical protein